MVVETDGQGEASDGHGLSTVEGTPSSLPTAGVFSLAVSERNAHVTALLRLETALLTRSVAGEDTVSLIGS